jgi:hypothetical protein
VCRHSLGHIWQMMRAAVSSIRWGIATVQLWTVSEE